MNEQPQQATWRAEEAERYTTMILRYQQHVRELQAEITGISAGRYDAFIQMEQRFERNFTRETLIIEWQHSIAENERAIARARTHLHALGQPQAHTAEQKVITLLHQRIALHRQHEQEAHRQAEAYQQLGTAGIARHGQAMKQAHEHRLIREAFEALVREADAASYGETPDTPRTERTEA